MNDPMQTYTGVEFFPLKPTVASIDIRDIAHGLARECRFGNHSMHFYSVAEHSVLVSEHVPAKYARQALLHDASEAYTHDMVAPLKHTEEMTPFRDMEFLIERTVFRRFGVSVSKQSNDAVKAVDVRIRVDEVRALMRNPDAYKARLTGIECLGVNIKSLPYRAAMRVFLRRFAVLFPEHMTDELARFNRTTSVNL